MTAIPTIGSSDVPVILGVNPWRSVWELWPRLVGLQDRYDLREGAAPAPMERGLRMEAALGIWYADVEDVELQDMPKVPDPPLPGPEPWMADRPDWLAPDRVVEGKTSRRLDAAVGWGQPRTGQVPLHVGGQCVWHMLHTDRERCDVVAFGTWDDDFRIYVLQRNEALERRIVDVCRNWYERHVTEGHAPPLDGSPAAAKFAHLVYPGAPGEKVWLEATREDVALAHDIAAAKSRLAEAKAELTGLQNQVRERIGAADAYGIRDRGRSLATWAPMKGRETVSVPGLRAALGPKAETLIRVGAPSRTLRTTAPKETE